jgi:hypothetical protein
MVSGPGTRSVAALTRSLDPLLNRLNTVCPYFTMFPLDFPLRVLRQGGPDAHVLDPFCGRGTTLYAARLLGQRSFGIDASPVAVAIAAAKQAPVDRFAVEALVVRLLTDTFEPYDMPEGEFWQWCYHPTTLRDICSLREQLAFLPDNSAATLLQAIMLGVLHGPLRKGDPTYLSNQMPRTYATKPQPAVNFWRKHGMHPPRVRVLDVLMRRIHHVLRTVPEPVAGEVRCGDSREVLKSLPRNFTYVVTSPPYYGMRSYVPDQWLRYWFLGGPAEVTYGYPSELGRGSREAFVEALRRVWSATADRCAPEAKLVVRFGALPSCNVSPREVLRESLRNTGWRITTSRDAGVPASRRRQASQFTQTGEYATEIDLYAVRS